MRILADSGYPLIPNQLAPVTQSKFWCASKGRNEIEKFDDNLGIAHLLVGNVWSSCDVSYSIRHDLFSRKFRTDTSCFQFS